MKNNLLGQSQRTFRNKSNSLSSSFWQKVYNAAEGRWRRSFLKQGVLNRKGRPKVARDISSTNRQIHYDATYISKRFTQ